jgi:hypothetical protein
LHTRVVEHPHFFESCEQVEEAEAITEGVPWEVRSGKERTSLTIHHNRQWPAAVSSKCLAYIHAHGIDIRTFFAIDLDADEVLVQVRRNGIVFK